MGSTYLMRGNKTRRFLTFVSTAIEQKNSQKFSKIELD